MTEAAGHSRKPVQARVLGELRRALMAGAFRPGQRFTVRAVADAMGVSPMPVRESIGTLAALGALVILPNGRAMVPGMTRAAFAELLDLRLLLEAMAAERAVPHVTRSVLDRLRTINAQAIRARGAGDVAGALEASRDFRFTLYAAAEQPHLISLIEMTYLRGGPFTNRAVTLFFGSGGDFQSATLAAIVDGDAARAAATIRDDSAHYGHRLLAAYPFEGDDDDIAAPLPLRLVI